MSRFSSEIMLIAPLKLGIVVLANCGTRAPAPANVTFVMVVFNPQLCVRVWQAMARILVPAFEAALRAIPPKGPPLPLDAFLGNYVNGTQVLLLSSAAD
jgi:hypothetical protein